MVKVFFLVLSAYVDPDRFEPTKVLKASTNRWKVKNFPGIAGKTFTLMTTNEKIQTGYNFKHNVIKFIKFLHSLCQQIWETQQGPQGWKTSILIPIPKNGSTKEC